jgi:hypothetical protein
MPWAIVPVKSVTGWKRILVTVSQPIPSVLFLLSVDEDKGKLFALCHIPETIVLVYDYQVQ